MKSKVFVPTKRQVNSINAEPGNLLGNTPITTRMSENDETGSASAKRKGSRVRLSAIIADPSFVNQEMIESVLSESGVKAILKSVDGVDVLEYFNSSADKR